MNVRRVLRKELSIKTGAALVATVPQHLTFADPASIRAHPDQRLESASFLYAPAPVSDDYFYWFAVNAWVATAVRRVVEACAASVLEVFRRNDKLNVLDDHGLSQLLGMYGQPNDAQNAGEFLEEHFLNYELTGNSYWFWFSEFGGRPSEIHHLDPRRVVIQPGKDRTVGSYQYRTRWGELKEYQPEQITHFKRPNPFSRYYGLSPLESLRLDVTSDRSMAEWNKEFFSDNVGIPAGIVFVPPDTPDKDMDRLNKEWNADFGTRRKTALLRGTPGALSYVVAGAVHKDLDFENGRLLSRRAVYEVLDLPLGLMSEVSTEANARVQERRFFDAADRRLLRTAGKIRSDALRLWPGRSSYDVRFQDNRRDVADHQQKQMQVETMLMTHSINEVRETVYSLPPVDWGEGRNEDGKQSSSTEDDRRGASEDNRSREADNGAGENGVRALEKSGGG